MQVKIPEKIDVSSFLWWLKEKSSLIIYEKYPELSETGNFGAEDIVWKPSRRMRRRWRRTRQSALVDLSEEQRALPSM